ncbi:AMP-binding protein [Kitasatospora sp. NPDC056651]|uniref:AMP-binding protein n=1 Tax=Kitasatospora sp. NPDC056651 TaxID=3345892 RepID=UPI0036886092
MTPAVTHRESYLDGFRDNVERSPRRVAVRFVGEDGEQSVDYVELDAAARATAGWLGQRCAAGDRVLLPIPSGIGFVQAFLGCLYAGVVPVPVPARGTHGRQEGRHTGIAADCAARLTLGEEELREALRATPVAGPPGTGPDDIAFLQYTSGSTSEPKGVMVPHRALLHNIGLMGRGLGWQEGTTWVSWLPAHHDMGLIGAILAPLHVGGTTVLMAATTFLKRPVSWLRLIERYRADVAPAPNFAWDLCTRKLTDEQIAGLDLSHHWNAVNGAEPIDPATLTRFAERLAPAGFRTSCFVPGYGLAEATLTVTHTRSEQPPLIRHFDTARLAVGELVPVEPAWTGSALVGNGAVRDLDVRIVEPESRRELPAGRVGEIWVRGGSVALGYWGKPQETADSFDADTADGEGGFLRTGDLGALLDGELFVTGRRKDLIIVHGRNLYPQDLERDLQGLDPAFAGLPAAAVQLPAADGERIVLVQEVRLGGTSEELGRLARRAKAELARAQGVPVAGLVLVGPGRLPRTTSGKLQRSLTRELLMKSRFETLHAEFDDGCEPGGPDRTAEIRGWLVERVAESLNRSPERIATDAHLVELGLDSLGALSICGEAEDRFGLRLEATIAWDHPTIDALAAFLTAELERA